MVTIRLDNCELKVYGSIKELPIELSKKMQSYLLQDAGIGSTIQDVDSHLQRLTTFIAADKKDEVREEIANMRLNLFAAIMGMRFDCPAFACLIHSVDGVPVEDRSINGLNELMADLSAKGLTNEKMESILSDVKKNLIPSEDFISLNYLPMT